MHTVVLLEQALEELEDEGVELYTARDGREALDFIAAEKPQLVFLDVMMPEMNGYEVCQEVKQVQNFKEVFIIMLTAKGQEFDKIKGEEVGADVYMTKPFDPDEVVEKAAEVLGL